MEEWPQFDSSVVLGVEQIDREHRRLFDLARRVYDNLGADKLASSAAIDAADELIDYTATHFAAEEALMEAAGYPELEAHREQHAQLLSKARDMAMRAQSGDRHVPAELSHFLLNWLVGHIQANDRLFCQFMAARR